MSGAARRVRALLSAHLAAADPGAGLPWASLGLHALVAGVLCGLVRSELDPFAYGLFALGLTGALVALPLLGDLGHLLRADSSWEWVSALPVSAAERRIARTLQLLIVLLVLAAGSLVPAALLSKTGLADGLLLLAGGVGLALFLAAALLLVQSLLGGRAEPLLVLAQMLLTAGVVVGLTAGLRHVPELAALGGPSDRPALLAFPPALFAAPLDPDAGALARLLPLAVALASLVVLAVAPLPAQPTRGSRLGLLDRLLLPARALATRLWVRADERGPFDLVYDALPREREVVLRTYPLLGIPIAFLLLGASGEPGSKRDGLLVLLLFTAGTYLPVLLTHVPASSSAAASWIHERAPVAPGAVAGGALKALAVRFLLPLYVLLALVTWQLAGLGFALRFALPGALVSLIVMRLLWRTCVTAPPLSILPEELPAHPGLNGAVMTAPFVLTFVAVGAFVLVTDPLRAAVFVALLLAIERLLDRSWALR